MYPPAKPAKKKKEKKDDAKQNGNQQWIAV